MVLLVLRRLRKKRIEMNNKFKRSQLMNQDQWETIINKKKMKMILTTNRKPAGKRMNSLTLKNLRNMKSKY